MWRQIVTGWIAKQECAPYEIASLAMPAASLPYPFSYSSTLPLESVAPFGPTPNMLKFRTCTRSCSTAPLLLVTTQSQLSGTVSAEKGRAHLNVSQAAIKTRRPFCTSQKQTLDKFVLFPTPFTPTNAMLYGSRCCEDGRGEDSLVRMESRRSVDVFGVRIRVREVERACRKADEVATGL